MALDLTYKIVFATYIQVFVLHLYQMNKQIKKYMCIYIYMYGDRSKTILFKFSLRVGGDLWGSLKPASHKFRARPAQGFAQGKL